MTAASPALSRYRIGDWVFEPAVSGWFPKRAPQPRRPVPIFPDPWPGRPVRGRDNQARAQACWLPIAAGLTPHGLRHSHKSLMSEFRTPEVLSHERLGHQLGGIAGRYSHVTEPMRRELMEGLTRQWEAALDARAAISPHSPVAALDALLQARIRSGRRGEDSKIFSQDSPRRGVTHLSSRPRKGA